MATNRYAASTEVPADRSRSEIGRLFLRMLPPPGRPISPERRHAYLTTVRAIIEDTWGGPDA